MPDRLLRLVPAKAGAAAQLAHRVLDYYRRHGPRETILAAWYRGRARPTRANSLKALERRFPDKFRAGEAGIAHAAAGVLQPLLAKLEVDADPDGVLAALKSNFGTRRHYGFLDDLFAVEQALCEYPEGKDRALMRASALPAAQGPGHRRTILFITAHCPDMRHGGGNRVLSFMKILARTNDLYLCTSFIRRQDEQALEAVRPYCRSILTLPRWRFGGSQARIRQWLNGQRVDVVHYEWPAALENYDPELGRLHVFTYMEAVSLRLLIDLARLKPVSPAWLDKLTEMVGALRLELADASRLDARIAVTTKDGEFFRTLQPRMQYVVLNHGINMDEFVLPDAAPEPRALVYVGNYQHYPNLDAMQFFLDRVWPAILQRVPDVRLYMVGAHLPADLQRRADGRHLVAVGSVPDIRPLIQRAALGIAPLVSGAGLRGKVIEYAALRRTFVATLIAMTDLAFQNGRDYLHADEAGEFARHVVTLLEDEPLRRRMAESAYGVALECYDNQRLVEQLVRLYDHLEVDADD